MKEYKLVRLNPKLHFSEKTDIAEAEQVLNQHVREGWILEQVVQYHGMGALIAVMYKESYQLN